ncbi:response regulator transcription factor [Cohnella lubricantis]|uniref:Response regulator transcription factor n=1 Tax=Cohnella lubricantis TaxID=2163172 RepID=A0A841T8G3_9BACL|nr:response regulator transcription factor [Cohnella lubricantis]MBB6677222.1 response regulator transcription factor [Cohnella lubricantis]MBP2116968.1 DNA-binding response OmpR family regulator [Cohnella lubricantis]
MTKILVIEDEIIIGEMISMYLTDEQFSVCRVENGKAGLEAMQSFAPDVILLDLMLPDLDGIELCESVRRHSDTPIIVISMNTKVNERVRALNAGADDYMCKPFSMQELKARIGAAVRRYKLPHPASAEEVEVQGKGEHGIVLDLHKRLISVGSVSVETTFSEFELLKLLFEFPGRVFTRDELISALRGIDSYVNDRAIDVHITNLRKKIETNPKEPQFIKTVWGVGYKLSLD